MNVPSRIAGSAHPEECAWPQLLVSFGELVPPYPDTRVVPAVIVPAPPLLPDDLPDADAGQRVALASVTALEARLSQRLPGLRQRVLKGECRTNAEEFAEALRNARIPPMAWALFSYDHWVLAPPVPVPKLAWMVSVTRLNQRRVWYMEERLRYEVERVHLTPLHRKLAARWQVMQHALLRESSTLTSVRVQEIVAAHFRPDGLAAYARVSDAARERAHNAQAEVTMRVQRGECLW